ncbi:MAG: hypothetical protein COX77_01375, partial [Candidatus Komeilibacteria bacterium CG_4_10_14_0_2_um_filter_37_10]
LACPAFRERLDGGRDRSDKWVVAGVTSVGCSPKAGPPPRHASALAQRTAEASAGLLDTGLNPV